MERRVEGKRRVIAVVVVLAVLVVLLVPQRIQFAVRRGQVVHYLEDCLTRRLALPPEAQVSEGDIFNVHVDSPEETELFIAALKRAQYRGFMLSDRVSLGSADVMYAGPTFWIDGLSISMPRPDNVMVWLAGEAMDPRIELRLKLHPKDREAMLDYIMRFDASIGYEWSR